MFDDDLMDIIKGLLMGIIIVLGLGIMLYSLFMFIYCISGAKEADEQAEQQLHECFIQEPRSKECEYLIWKAEMKAQKKTQSNNLATGVIIGTTLGMAGARR